jgi:hypothetical protein
MLCFYVFIVFYFCHVILVELNFIMWCFYHTLSLWGLSYVVDLRVVTCCPLRLGVFYYVSIICCPSMLVLFYCVYVMCFSIYLSCYSFIAYHYVICTSFGVNPKSWSVIQLFFLLVQACAPFEVGPKSSTSSSHVFLKLRAHPNLVKALGFCCYWQIVMCIDVLCRTCTWWISKFVGVVLSIKAHFWGNMLQRWLWFQ